MQFNSYVFIMAFMPLMVFLYFLLGKINIRTGKAVIITGSLVFYAYSDVTTLEVLGMSLLINFFFVKLMEELKWKKFFTAIPVIINIGLLFYFKYTNFAIANINTWFHRDIPFQEILLPAGISFFTFQQIAYAVAVRRGELEKADIIDYMGYILYFPKLLMGPLMDPVDFVEQFNDPELKKIKWDNIACGVKIFCFGLFKKMLLADTFAKAVSWGYANMEAATSMDWILVMLFYTMEIYFDFSGYSDMATGTSLMLNITLPINFDSPYKAVSIRDFWKRWHISLTRFLTKYIYIPLGGNRRGLFFTCINTMIVFLISGIWHGANWTFILWGILHGVLSIFDRLTEKITGKIFKPARWVVTFIMVNILWLLFRSDTVEQWIYIIKNMVSFSDMAVSDGLLELFIIPESDFILHTFTAIAGLGEMIHEYMMSVFIAGSFIICFFLKNNYRNLKKISWPDMVFATIAIVWGITCLSGESVFVYFNF